MMEDLFSHATKSPPPSYKEGGVGWQKRDTSRRAAEEFADKAPRLQELILASLRRDGPATFYEMATRLGVPDRNVQPRFTELQKKELVVTAAFTRPSPFGKQISVWKLKEEK